MDTLALANAIELATQSPCVIQQVNSVGGGCINSAYKLKTENTDYFVKFNTANKLSMFEAEAEGLAELSRANAIRVPIAICCGLLGSQSYIVMEYISLSGRGSMARFAAQLVALHQRSNPQFGWHRENTIGSTEQINNNSDNWLDFWQQHRLGYQLSLAKYKGANKKLLDGGERLLADLGLFFGNYQPVVSLLHGDLWSGNYAFSDDSEPVIFDPATYYGDREAEIAMTELFGGFSVEFYDSYQNLWPLDEGYNVRKTLYNLYHILNHFNMFGGGYESQANGMISRLLSEI